MSDTPRDQGWDPDRDRAGKDDDAAAAEPTTGPPGGAVAASSAAFSTPASPAPSLTGPNSGLTPASTTTPGTGSTPTTATTSGTGRTSTGTGTRTNTGTGTGTASSTGTGTGTASSTGTGTGTGTASSTGTATGTGPGNASATNTRTGDSRDSGTGATGTKAATTPGSTTGSSSGAPNSTGTQTQGRSRASRLSPAGPETDARKRRRRRWLIGGIAAGAALLVIALCAGGLAVVSAIDDVRADATDAREVRRLRDTACLELEQRLNRLMPPGAATSVQGRAVAVRDENAALRIYVGQIRDSLTPDGWRQLIDARTAYAEALDTQARSRTPAFFVAPRTRDGVAVSDELVELSPDACAGPIRRLAAPDL